MAWDIDSTYASPADFRVGACTMLPLRLPHTRREPGFCSHGTLDTFIPSRPPDSKCESPKHGLQLMSMAVPESATLFLGAAKSNVYDEFLSPRGLFFRRAATPEPGRLLNGSPGKDS